MNFTDYLNKEIKLNKILHKGNLYTKEELREMQTSENLSAKTSSVDVSRYKDKELELPEIQIKDIKVPSLVEITEDTDGIHCVLLCIPQDDKIHCIAVKGWRKLMVMDPYAGGAFNLKTYVRLISPDKGINISNAWDWGTILE